MCHDATAGPDWTDVRRLMIGVEKAHECSCSLLLLPDGRKDGLGWCLIAGAIPFGDLGVNDRNGIVMSARWPNNTHSTLSSAAFNLIYELDYGCARTLYVNRTLWND